MQEIADANGGNRATGTPGHEASADYVAAQLEATGYYDVSSQPFIAEAWEELAPTTLSADPAAAAPWAEGADYQTMSGSGTVAVVQRGTCDFGLKARTAQDRGAAVALDRAVDRSPRARASTTTGAARPPTSRSRCRWRGSASSRSTACASSGSPGRSRPARLGARRPPALQEAGLEHHDWKGDHLRR